LAVTHDAIASPRGPSVSPRLEVNATTWRPNGSAVSFVSFVSSATVSLDSAAVRSIVVVAEWLPTVAVTDTVSD
jgi:hypothetical protein